MTLSIIIGCNIKDRQDRATSITGTYINQSESKYSKAIDSLSITAYNAKAGTYLIERKTGFHRIQNGKLLPKEYKTEELIAQWDEQHHQLQEQKYGTLYSFPLNGGELLAGTVRYQKINH